MVISNTVEGPAVSDKHASETAQAVLLICVKFGADSEVAQYLQSVRSLRGQQHLRVLVVDNTVEDSVTEASEAETYPVIKTGKNLGYLGGARCGLSYFLAHNPLPDWIIISNTDLAIPDPEFLHRLSQAATISDLGALAPSIRSGLTGRDQNPFMRTRPTAFRMHFYKLLYRNWLLLNLYEIASALFHKVNSALRNTARNVPEAVRNLSEAVYAPHGSFLILSKNYFAAGGDLEYPEFLFGEEIYIAENIRRLGLKVMYDPSLKVLHEEHRSTKLFRSRKMASYVAPSAAYCANTFFPLHKINNKGSA